MKVSAVIIARDEEAKIGAAIRSVKWADEVLVIDSESADKTREIAHDLGARVIVNPWPGFSRQKQFGTDAAANDWILSLDADERISPELAAEIQKLTKASSLAAGYRIPRLSYYMGRAIRHSGWYPDRQLRLFDRKRARWNDNVIHESVRVVEGEKAEKLRGDILHFSVDSPAHHHEMIGTRYAPLGARQMFERGKRTSPFGVAVAGPVAFLHSYLLKAGFLDGFPGFCIARFAAHHAYLKHLLLWEMQRKDDAT
ncbi:MAG TPA: glycosyltransferase family 2 protein [Pyrinomonadaceae bacterium]|nr:glycosyltransferase family 2 protein [Pyrinomonadaceae bacterium]